MSPSTDPARPADDSPTIAEVAALTRRLRELSTQGRPVDPAERAAFLAAKDALLARITDAHRDTGRGPETSPDPAAGATEAAATDTASQGLEMPQWMREHAARTEAQTVAGTAPPPRPDDPAELAARIAALRERIAARTAETSDGADTAGQDGGAVRRKRLTRSHHDDTTAEHDAAGHDAAEQNAAGTVVDPLEQARHAVDTLPDPAPASDPDGRARRDRLALWHADDHAAGGDDGDAAAAGRPR